MTGQQIITGLEDFIAPLTLADFRILLRDRRLLHQRGGGVNRHAGLLSWEKLRAILVGGDFPPERLRAYRETRPLLPLFYTEAGRINAEKLDQLVRNGISLVVASLEDYDPSLKALWRDIRAHVPEKIQIGVIVTTGKGGALEQHYDNEDLLITQLEGRKRWIIRAPTVRHPTRGLKQGLPPGGEPIFDDVIEPGDVLFVPAGYWHRCENGPGLSLHMGALIEPPVAWRLVYDLAYELLRDAEFRAPLSRLDGAAVAALQARLKARLVEAANTLSLDNLVSDSSGDGERMSPLPEIPS